MRNQVSVHMWNKTLLRLQTKAVGTDWNFLNVDATDWNFLQIYINVFFNFKDCWLSGLHHIEPARSARIRQHRFRSFLGCSSDTPLAYSINLQTE